MKKQDSNEPKTNGKGKATWIKDHATGIVTGVVYGGLTIALGIVGVKLYKDNKRSMNLWKAATKAFRSGDKDYDYGPYKIAEFSNPFGEVIGNILMHEDSVESFLECEK